MLNTHTLYKSQLYENISIILPTPTERQPSPMEAQIIKIELYFRVSSKPNCYGIVRSNGNKTELHSPYNIEVTISPNSEFTLNIRKYPMKLLNMPTKASPFILNSGDPGKAAIVNLKNVIDIQYNDP